MVQALQGPGRAGRARAAPAGRAGPGGGARPAGRRDARRGDAPGQPDGAAGRARCGSPRPTRPPGRPPRNCGPRAARRWTNCATWSASCAPRRTGTRPRPAAGFAALVAESTAVGTPAELVEEGDPALASPVVGRTAYRIVREALTNVRKHAPGARVLVRVSYGESQVRLSVRNTAARRRRRAGAAWPRPAPAWAWPACGSASSWCTARCGPGRTPDGGFCARGHAARVRADRRAGRRDAVIRVVVVDDEPMVCAHLRTILGSAGDIEVVGRGARRRGRRRGRRCAAGPTWC